MWFCIISKKNYIENDLYKYKYYFNYIIYI